MFGKWTAHAVGSLLIIGLVFTLSPRVFAGDTDTARNYLSTIVSCLSTIFALCISITLVAIQLTASRYTHRVLDLFIKLPFNVSLTLFYFVTIIQSLFLLSRITEPIHVTLPSYLQPQMNADMVLVVMCFVILVAYMYAVMRMLKPEQIVAAIEREFRIGIIRHKERDALLRVEQICDIAKRAAGDMDSTTGMIAVSALQKMASTGTRETRASVTRQYIEIGGIAAKEREAGMLSAVLHSLTAIGQAALAERRLDDARDVIRAFERIVRSGLIGQQLFHFIEEAVSAIYDLAGKAIALSGEGVKERVRAESFAEDAFGSVRKIGEEVLARESEGASYVARTLLAVNFGRLLSQIASLAAQEAAITEACWRLLCGYLSLARTLLVKAELRDLTAITSWLREELPPADDPSAGNDAPTSPTAVLYTPCLLAAIATFVQRKDAMQLIVHAVAGRRSWPLELFSGIEQRRVLIRVLFDYRDPAPFVATAKEEWDSYRRQRETCSRPVFSK
ncbi:MAG: DUF2254 domain-containing protein [Firmicutes bacterium]|nr:DUF2254 domain-containing protein [Bacillota bacterium]